VRGGAWKIAVLLFEPNQTPGYANQDEVRKGIGL